MLDDTVKLINALEKLAATLSKAGPWLASLIAAIFFIAIAFAAATADRLSDKLPTSTTGTPRR